MSEDVPPPPDGFVPSARGPFTTHNGPLFHKVRRDGIYEHAFFVLARHCNAMGIVHGGMLTTFLDGLLARAVHEAVKAPSVTLHLSVDFLSAARQGQWVFGDAHVTRQARDITFAAARIHADGRDILHGSGLFKVSHQKTS
ncbi:MAG: PaaI family thioesterase [Hyphomonadaceae bacterium]|nr:PaaI family thioesterase [Hyphomonadaceae bacterium]